MYTVNGSMLIVETLSFGAKRRQLTHTSPEMCSVTTTRSSAGAVAAHHLIADAFREAQLQMDSSRAAADNAHRVPWLFRFLRAPPDCQPATSVYAPGVSPPANFDVREGMAGEHSSPGPLDSDVPSDLQSNSVNTPSSR
jgi:hypothetical protein